MIDHEANPRLVNTWPIKEFFISTLVRDISIIDSIIDLVDNSVDGATRLRGDDPYDGLEVRITANKKEFRIVDNCGGIEVDLARRYAFRFGRAEGFPPDPKSIGEFGVGLKRALFRLGKAFVVDTKAETSRFILEVNVEDWKKEEVSWDFELKDFEENIEIPPEERGTDIVVFPLIDGVAEALSLENFRTRLFDSIESRHRSSLDRGLVITLNQIPLGVRPLELLSSNKLKVGYKEMTIVENEHAPVGVRIFAGIADSDASTAGWYVFCNGRLILEADRSLTTGWGESRGTRIPSFHPQYNRFHGFVFFESDDGALLPWNTTKTDVVADSSIYKTVRLEMIKLMRPVIDFLNDLKKERDKTEDKGEDPGPLQHVVDESTPHSTHEVITSNQFEAPRPKREPQGPRMGRITYNKPKDQIQKVMKEIGASSQKEVGEKTFDFYYEMEVDE